MLNSKIYWTFTMSNENKSGLKPLGRAVLLRPYEAAVQSTLIQIPDSVQERYGLLDMRAVVVAVGDNCWPDEPARAKPGDRVLVAKMAGTFVQGTLDNVQYRVVNDRDIFMAIEQEA